MPDSVPRWNRWWRPCRLTCNSGVATAQRSGLVNIEGLANLSGPIHDKGVMILEGFLLHHGRPRHVENVPMGAAVLAGDYCYAQGLVRIAATGDLAMVEALGDLVALSAAAVASGRER